AHRAADPLKGAEGAYTDSPRRVAVCSAMGEEVLFRLCSFNEPATVGVPIYGHRIEARVLVVLVRIATTMPEATLEHAIAEHADVPPLVHRARHDSRGVLGSFHHERGLERPLDGDVDSLPTRLATVLEHEHRIVCCTTPKKADALRR